MSVRQYEQLTGAQQRVVDSAIGSMQMGSLPPTDAEIEVGRELAAGRIDFAEYLRRVSG